MVTLADLVETSSRVAATSGRLDKVALLAALLRRLEAAEVEIGTAYLTGSIRQPRLGVGYATVATLSEAPGADSASLTVSDVDSALEEIAQDRRQGLGPGTVSAPAGSVGPGHPSRAAVSGASAPRRVASGRARRSGAGCGRPCRGAAPSGSSTRLHDGGGPGKRSPNDSGRWQRAGRVRDPAFPAGAANARRYCRDPSRGVGAAWPSGVRISSSTGRESRCTKEAPR